MHLVENNKLDVPDQVGTFVKHRPQNFRRHDKTTALGIYLHIASQDAHGSGIEGSFEIAEFLVGEGFDGGRVDGSANPQLSLSE